MENLEERRNDINCISLENIKNIIKQMESCIYKIKLSNAQETIGFFTKIYFPYTNQYIQVLITNNHIFIKN